MKNINIDLLQRNLVGQLKENGSIKSEVVNNAFLKVPRHLFLPGVEPTKVYSDVVIGTKISNQGIPLSSSSQPSAMATMLEQLSLKQGDKVLEIGTGTGFNTALMAEIVGKSGHIVTLDIDKDITDNAKNALTSAGYQNVTVVCQDGFPGYNQFAPYDKIILTVAAWDISPNWINQLKQNGFLLLPLLFRISQKTICFEKINNHLESRSNSNCAFMSWRGLHSKPSLQQILVDKEIMLSTFSITDELVDTERTLNLLSNKGKEFKTGIMATVKEIQTSLFQWIDIRKTNICGVYISEQSSKKKELTLFPATREFSSSIGLMGNDCISLLSPMPDFALPDFDLKTSSIEICIKQFGENNELSEKLLDSIVEWNRTGRPLTEDFELRIIPFDMDYQPVQNEIVISKKWTKLIYLWRNGKE